MKWHILYGYILSTLLWVQCSRIIVRSCTTSCLLQCGYSVQESLSNHVKLPVYCIAGTMFKNHCPNMFFIISCFEIMIIVMFHYWMVAWELEIYIFKFTFLYLISNRSNFRRSYLKKKTLTIWFVRVNILILMDNHWFLSKV